MSLRYFEEMMMYCSKCGKENTDASIFCFSCGNKLAEKAPEKVIPVVVPKETPELCSKCGKENQEGSVFCASCGSKLPEQSQEIIASVAVQQKAPEFYLKHEHENQEGAVFCGTCGKNLASHTFNQTQTTHKASAEFKEMNIFLLLFYIIITFGIYAPIWFIKNMNAINNLNSKEKLNDGDKVQFQMIAAFYALVLIIVLLTSGNPNSILDKITTIFSIGGAIALGILSLKVRRIFQEHFNGALQKSIKFSGIWTFLLTSIYLQYKINKIIENK